MNSQNSFLVPTQRTPVSNMIFQNYNGHMTWGDPNIMETRKLMRYCYENRNQAQDIGSQAALDIKTKYNKQAISKLILDRLNQIMEKI
jgi:hypothetical protein